MIQYNDLSSIYLVTVLNIALTNYLRTRDSFLDHLYDERMHYIFQVAIVMLRCL